MFPVGGSMHQSYGPVPSVDEFVDLDNFLDSYLSQLHSEHQASRQLQQTPAHQQQPQQQALPGPAGSLGPAATGHLQHQQQQQGGMGMVGAQPMGMMGVPGMQQLQHTAHTMPTFDPAQQAHAMQGSMSMLGQVPGMSGLGGMGGLGQMPGLGGISGLSGGFGGQQPGMQGFGVGSMTSAMSGIHSAMGGMGMAGMGMVPGAMPMQGMQQQQQQAAGAGRTSTAGGTSKSTRGRGGRQGARGSKKSEADHHTSSEHGDSSDDASSDGEHKSRKKQMTADEQERRHLALQEKNRRAQRRFRERQKTKLQDLHKQIDELTSKVSLLQNENSALHSRTSILEKVLDMRNEQIQVMQETKEGTGYPSQEEELLQIQDMGGQLVQLTPDMVKELSSDQIYKIYQLYVKELSSQLTASNPPLGSPTGSGEGGPSGAGSGDLDVSQAPHIDKLVKDLSMMIMRLGVIKPLETRKFIVVSRQYLGNNETEVIQLWKNVMKAIDLVEAQKREVVELKRMFLTKIEPIMEERKHLNVQIQANLPHDTFHTKNALTYIKAHEAVIKLRDNLRAEQHVVLEFAIAVFRGVFKPRQMATLLVKCYPAVPDALGIASALAAELGEPDTAGRQLTMHLGGYNENNNGGTLHYTPLLPGPGQGQGTQQPGNTNGSAPIPMPGSAGANASGEEQFNAWLDNHRTSIPGGNDLMAIAQQGTQALVGSPQPPHHSYSGGPSQ